MLLDSFLTIVPHQPKTKTLEPLVVDMNGSPSNSIYDCCHRITIKSEPNIELEKVGENYISKAVVINQWGGSAKTFAK